jgi:hypothetical protein
MAKAKYVNMTGFVDYARVFPENMDDNMEYHGDTQGQFNVNFYPESDEELQKYFDAGVAHEVLGHSTVKEGDPDIGMGKYVKLTRPNVHPKFENLGGAPAVYDFRDGPSAKRWSMEEDGELGSRSKVHVKVCIFGSGPRATKRLESMAVLELNEWKPERDPDAVPDFD